MTSHLAPTPQVPTHGFTHFWLVQASFPPQSEFTTHSGLQAGGDPLYPARHEHTDCPLTARHWLYGPQGDGWQGVGCTGSNIL